MAGVTIANGGDNLGVFVPWLAILTANQIAMVIVVFVAMTALWLAIGHWLVHHRTHGAPIRRLAQRVLPFALIVLGLGILYQAGSLDLLSFA